MSKSLNVMLSLPKHLYRESNSFTAAVEMLRQAQHDVLFLSVRAWLFLLLLTIWVSPVAAQAPNDNIENRRVLRLEETIASNTTGCTVQRSCVSTALTDKLIQYHNDQWFEFTPSAAGQYFVNVSGQHCRYLRGIQVVALTGEPCQLATYRIIAARSLGTQDDVFVPLARMEAGQRYLLNIDGYAHDLCSFRLQVSRRPHGLPATEAVSTASHNSYGRLIELGWHLPDTIIATHCQVWRRDAREQASILVGRVPVTRNNLGRQTTNYSIFDTLAITKVPTAFQYRVVAERANGSPVLMARHDMAWAPVYNLPIGSPPKASVPMPVREPEAIPAMVEISLAAFKPGTMVRIEMLDALTGQLANEETVTRSNGPIDSHTFPLRKFFPDGAKSVRLRMSGTQKDGRPLVVDFVY